MSMSINTRLFRPTRETFALVIKWVVALLVPVIVFNLWNGESIINTVISPGTAAANTPVDPGTLIQVAIFIVIFYGAMITLTGYLVAADSGQRKPLSLWLDMLVFVILPLVLVIILNDLIIGLAICAVIWGVYIFVRGRIRKAMSYVPPVSLPNLKVLDAAQRDLILVRARMGGFWFAIAFAVVWLIQDLIYYFSGTLPLVLLIIAVVRIVLLPVIGYFLGQLGGTLALRYTLAPKGKNGNGVANGGNSGNGENDPDKRVSKRRRIEVLGTARAREEAKDIVPNDMPLRSSGAQRFYLTLLIAFVIFYPVLDPFLFGFGTAGRLASYGDAGRYVILALGLNIVVGFAGLLDLGYVAFFAIGAYAWSMIGSQQITSLTGIVVNPSVWPWLFWPMIIVGALIAAFWGIILGAPTLRLRGDYLAIVTLGFGEIVPVVFLNLRQFTGGTNGLVGVFSPAFFGISWSTFTPIPYYYLIIALIVLCIFANVRLRDSRLGRAWVAIREDEIAAASSGINLVRTKLFAFGAGAFFSGIAGVYYASKLGGVSPENFSFSDSVIYLAMVVIGGLGSIPGVIVGALVVYTINVLVLSQLDNLASDPQSVLHPFYAGLTQIFPGFSFSNIRNLIFGVILVTIMIVRPEGLIPNARRRREFHHVENEEIEVGSIDVVPGAPGFESEIHVE